MVAKNNLKVVLIISFLSAIAYPMVLYAYKYSDVSLVSPLREISTAIATVMGIVLLKEKLSPYKVVGVSFIVIGAILITY